MEGISGSPNADVLIGNNLDNYFRGRGGNDTIDGGGGVQRPADNTATDTSPVNADLFTGIAQDGEGGTDTIPNIETLFGSDYNDTLRGNGADNLIEGRGGDDWLMGREGNDTLDGGDGFNYAEYSYLQHADGYNFVLGVDTMVVTGRGSYAYTETDTVINIGAYYGTAFGDSMLLTVAGCGGIPWPVWAMTRSPAMRRISIRFPTGSADRTTASTPT